MTDHSVTTETKPQEDTDSVTTETKPQEDTDTDSVLRGLLKQKDKALLGALDKRDRLREDADAETATIVALRREVARLRIALGLPARETQPKAEPGEAGGAGGAG